MTVTLQIIGSLSCLICLANCLPLPSGQDLKNQTPERENEVALLESGDDALRSAVLDIATLKLEDLYEQEVINTALDILQKERKNPDKAVDELQELGKTVRRDKRKVEILTAALGASSGALSAGASGSSSGAGGSGSESGEGEGGGGGGSGSGSILNLVGPLLGSSSGGGGGGGGDDSEGGGGGGGSNILGLLSGLLGSSSGGGGADGGESGDSSGGGGGGSGSGSILSLLGPLLGSSSGGGGGGGGGEEGGEGSGGGGGGSDSGSILGLIGPLLGSSSGGGGGGGASAGAGVGGSIGASASGDQLFQSKDPISLLGDKVQLVLRIKFALLTKVLQTISGVLASSTQPQSEKNGVLVYPPPKQGLFG